MSTTLDDASRTISLRVATAMSEVPAAAWNACAQGPRGSGGQPSHDDPDNPFISHAFLSALEDSGAVSPRTGWSPAHIIAEDTDGIQAVCPAYLKTHSMGEYVFDHSWADAYERAGGRYYPKLQVSVPFTPATGRRLLVRAEAQEAPMRAALIAGLRAVRDEVGASSIHATFMTKDEWDAMATDGFLQRMDQQFHWQNNGFTRFDDFLEALASRKRKTIRRERKDALQNGLSIEWVTGRDLTEAHWDAFHAFYLDTGSRKWGRPYLNRAFFSLIGERMADRVLLVMAKRAGRYVAGAINFIGGTTLYGRNWGAIEEHPFLHFEVCYYQAIDFALERGLARVEAGAQGEHKLARGYLPTPTYSAHDFADPGFRKAISDYLKRERAHVAAVGEALNEAIPFKKA
jgi:hypothetical protein